MINALVRRTARWAAAVALPLSLLLTPGTATATATATEPAAATPTAAAAEPAAVAPARLAPPVAAVQAPCPTVADPLFAAATRDVDPERVTPDPVYRTDCRPLYRADNRDPATVFAEGFQPWDVAGQYDLESYVLVNQPSPFVSTSYDRDLYQKFRTAFNYHIDAPGGIDANATIGYEHRYADQQEVAFLGGVDSAFIVRGCPVDPETGREDVGNCVANPHYEPWRAAAQTRYAPAA